ncbi:hypothetical protein [Pandoraea oxalativorans]|uniref:Uncharacterized protein n=1 Tax=Pandoraea oxalativorans TaxID=573737 RepID=A0A0E3U815_9BURK|nr:hypothetical protein [Pandoraea oxalativorans]AKC71339.1 hypothetical protein MB84_20560 [Pandoraea oxalativorans]
MKLAPLATLLCVLPFVGSLAGCYVVQYPGGALTLSPTPTTAQAMRAAPGTVLSGDVATAPVPTPTVASTPVRPAPTPAPVYPNGSPVPRDFQPGNTSPVPPDYRPPAASGQAGRSGANLAYPTYPNGSPVPPDYVPPQTSQPPQGNVADSTYSAYSSYSPDPRFVPYAAYPAYPAYPTYAAYPTYPVYAAYPAYAPVYPAYAPSPWLGNVSLSFSWGRGWGSWGGRCCHRWR